MIDFNIIHPKTKYIAILFLNCFVLISCKKEIIKSVPKTDSTSIKINALNTDSTILNPADTLKNLVSTSVIGTQFLTKSSLAPRLQSLLGTDYDQMVKDW